MRLKEAKRKQAEERAKKRGGETKAQRIQRLEGGEKTLRSGDKPGEMETPRNRGNFPGASRFPRETDGSED